MKAVILKAYPCTNSDRDEWEILVPMALLKFWHLDVQAGPWPGHAARCYCAALCSLWDWAILYNGPPERGARARRDVVLLVL